MFLARVRFIRIIAFALGLTAGLGALWAAGVFRWGRAEDPLEGADLFGGRLRRGWDDSLGSPPRFVDRAEAAGIAFRHENGATGKCLYLEIMGGGVGLFDADGDGLLDVYLVNGNKILEKPSPAITNRLYRNAGDFTFSDVTAKAAAAGTGYGQGCCAADYDNDGDEDLYVSNFGPNVLYRNRGDGTFEDVTAAAGVGDPGWGQTCTFLDSDSDGWLDLYVQNYLTWSPENQPEAFILLGSRKLPDYPAPANFRGSPSRLFRNRGDGTFADVSEASGIGRIDGKGMGCAAFDVDDDGRTDLFVTNDGIENFFFHNRGNGVFEEAALSWGLAYDGNGIPEGSMGVDVGDCDGDGRLDIIQPCLKRQSFTLYRNEGSFFSDASSSCGLTEGTSWATGFSANFLDHDNDGDLDLFFSNGGVRTSEAAPPDSSYEERYGITDLLFANDGKGRFVDVSAIAGAHFERRLIGRGSAAGDLDNDGDIDLVISNLAGPAVVLRNETRGGRWITLTLVPREGNRDALGANVWLEAEGATRRAAVHGGVTYLSQCDRRVHFGLGKAEKVDRITIRWPNGERQVLEDLPANRFLTIEQGKPAAR
jgi:hypothetical protein